VRYGPLEYNEPWHVVVGVVGEARNQTLRTLRRNSVYVPSDEFEWTSLAYVVHMRAGMADPALALRARIVGIDRNIAVSRVINLKDVVRQSIWQERFFATLLAGFGGLALLLALIGLYGVLAYTVSQRTHEMGVRMALGASAGTIRTMILTHSGKLVGAGLLLGAIAAAFLTRSLRTPLYEITPGDPGILACVAVLLAGAATAASYFPA
jgi:putative ABC transport system permease protein